MSYVPTAALVYAAAVPVTVNVSEPTKPLRAPTVTAPAAVVPSYTFDAIVGAPMLKALAVIVPVKPVGCVSV